MEEQGAVALKALRFVALFGQAQFLLDHDLAPRHRCNLTPTCQHKVLCRRDDPPDAWRGQLQRVSGEGYVGLYKKITRHLLKTPPPQLDHFKNAWTDVQAVRDKIAHNAFADVRLDLDDDRYYLALGYFQPIPGESDWFADAPHQIDAAFLDRAIDCAGWLVDAIKWTELQSGMNGTAPVTNWKGERLTQDNAPASAPRFVLTRGPRSLAPGHAC